ncbi:anti-sigma E factor [Deinococcus malanensis]|uniref:Regulator of SigK n=1 Tax=Deinococcus malanensis TaxID=1706855 RepID=A0ABQ2EI99_9DEIO|nr:anti-sigma factor [Deinococcus malanensis]GGK12733.1 anti-sigma E factor [Deinococcus malanensis]
MTVQSDHLLAYALGQLDPVETARVEAELQADPVLQAELQQHLDALTTLVDDLDLAAVQVPADAEERLLARVRAEEAGTAPHLQAVTPSSISPHAADPVPALHTGPVRRKSWWVPAGLSLAAALALAFFLRPAEDPVSRYARLPGAVTKPIETPGEQLGTLVRLADGRVYVHLKRPPADGRTYQLWHIRDGQPASLGVFAGDGLLTGSLPQGATLAVSVEPPGGSPQPTTEPLFAQGV